MIFLSHVTLRHQYIVSWSFRDLSCSADCMLILSAEDHLGTRGYQLCLHDIRVLSQRMSCTQLASVVEVLVLLRISYASALLSPRLHMLLWRHGIPAALLRGLLLLEVSLVLHCLLLVGGHVWRLRLSLLHALRRHGLRHRRRRRLLLFWRVDSGLSIDAIRVAGIRSIQARLPWLLARFDQCEVSVCIDVAYLDQILAFWLRDKWLKLGCRERVDQTSL